MSVKIITGGIYEYKEKESSVGAACVMPNTYSQIYIQIVFADKFNWQEGFGAFSYSRSHIDAVIKYIIREEAHHRKKTFKEEFLSTNRSPLLGLHCFLLDFSKT